MRTRCLSTPSTLPTQNMPSQTGRVEELRLKPLVFFAEAEAPVASRFRSPLRTPGSFRHSPPRSLPHHASLLYTSTSAATMAPTGVEPAYGSPFATSYPANVNASVAFSSVGSNRG
eukprot:GHVS01063031.1.p2 GENE.GHVS01063031.1~~GHVS01063031.1.p2  ORF type:complete len:116 (-),score=20.51 GHVS01063031.1:310-657(-)